MAIDKSVQLTIYESIKTKIEQTVSDIKRVVVWNNQPNYEIEERPYEYPYIGVEMSVEWMRTEASNRDGQLARLTQNQQKGIVTINIHHVFENLNNETDSFVTIENIRHKCFRALNNLDNAQFTPLERIASAPDSDHDRVIILVDTYTTEAIEYAIIDDTLPEVEFDDLTVETNGELIITNYDIRTGTLNE